MSAPAVPAAPAPSDTQAAAPREAATRPDAVETPRHSMPQNSMPQHPAAHVYSEAELDEDAEWMPVLSPREQRRLERMERRRASHERRMRHRQHLHLPLVGRIF